jgi:hypothetical protein
MSVGPGQREVVGKDLREPERSRWPDNGRVEVVVDPNWLIDGKPRVVRRVGWRNCHCCKRRFFSADIAKVRMCDPCKEVSTDMSCGARNALTRAKHKRPGRRRAVVTTYDLSRVATNPSGGIGVSHPAFKEPHQSQGQS